MKRIGLNLCWACVVTLVATFSLLGCGESDDRVIPTVSVNPGVFEMRIRAFGELQAARATSLDLPRTLRGMQRVAWLAGKGSRVAEGDIVCELDADQIAQEIEQRQNGIAKVDFQADAKRQELRKERLQLEGQIALLQNQRNDAEATAPREESIFSRHEIIEAKIDLDLIDTRLNHAQQQLRRAEEKERTEMQILQSQRNTEMTRLAQLEDARAQLIIRAPHDGFFLPGRTWQGEEVSVGMSLFGGQSIGQLPDVSTMEANVHVLEAEAAGLAPDLPIEVSLDAFPGFVVQGKVRQVQPVANPLNRQSPVKYFDVVLSLDHTDTDKMRPGSEVEAVIFVKHEESVLSVPNQAIFVEEGKPWIYVRDGGRFERRSVELGERSLSRTVIAAGLEPGDSVALVHPVTPAEQG